MMPASLSECLHLNKWEALALVGAGGKTTVVNTLAAENNAKRVLIMPTTKIRPPVGIPLNPPFPINGVQAIGRIHPLSGKLCAPPPEQWLETARHHDLVLMEADGSHCLPCKGWADFEPVVPDFTTMTIGVITTKALGCPANSDVVFRLPLFLQLTGLCEGDEITFDALADMVGAPGGMFHFHKGQATLLINQVDSLAGIDNAKTLAEHVKKRYPDVVGTIFAGSAHQNKWVPL